MRARTVPAGAALAIAVGSLLGGLGCYQPKIKDDTLVCGPGNSCPDGYTCDVAGDKKCKAVQSKTDGGAGGTGGKGGTGGLGGKGGAGGNHDGGAGAGAVDASPDLPCNVPVSGCVPHDGGLCDPVCQTGCGDCHDKCSVNTAGALTCNPPHPYPGENPGLQQLCHTYSSGASQSDDCPANEVCISAECGSRCKQFCRTNTDCTNASCSRDAGGGLKVCDVPFVTCDPSLGGTASGCAANQGCYFSSDYKNTFCDCQIGAPGITGSRGDTCTQSRGCLPAGLVCYDPTGGNTGQKCYRVCHFSTDGGASECITGPSACLHFPAGSTTAYGYCNE